MYTLDIRTLTCANFASALAMAVMMLLVWRIVRQEKGLERWFAGSALLAAAFFLMLLRGIAHDFLSIVVANILLTLSMGYFYIGARLFVGLKHGSAWHWAGAAATAVSFWYYTFIQPDTAVRIALISGCVALFLLATALVLMRTLQRETRLVQGSLALQFLLSGGMFGIRALLALSADYGPDYFHVTSPLMTVPLMLLLVLQLSTSVSIALLVSARLQARLSRLSYQDELTQIANRRYFNDVFHSEWERAQRLRSDIAVIMIDIDFFKRYNDFYGHPAGDVCLTRIAAAIRSVLTTPRALAARYGGEEFVVLLPGVNDEAAKKTAIKIQAAIAALEIRHEASPMSPQVTVSLGIASVQAREDDSDGARLIAAADQCLYKAKDAGRNRWEAIRLTNELHGSHTAGAGD